MDRAEMVALIRGGVPTPGGAWAEIGAGMGHFTLALAELLGPGATITAIDRDAQAVRQLMRLQAPAAIVPRQADFTRPLGLAGLDGVLAANALHFARDQAAVVAQLVAALRPGGRLLVVEYHLLAPRPWVPFPLPPERLAALAARAGLGPPAIVGQRRSPSSGIEMYAAVCELPQGLLQPGARPVQ
jgi:SAM-dependent methyltransferase